MQATTMLDPDLPSDEDVLAMLGDWEAEADYTATDAFGQTLEGHEETRWLKDLVAAESDLARLVRQQPRIDVRAARPVEDAPEYYTFSHDPTVVILQEVYWTLEWWFEQRMLKLHYRPSAYAERFLNTFRDCAYLHDSVVEAWPSVPQAEVEGTLADLNGRLTAFYREARSAACRSRRERLKRNRRHNRRSFQTLIEGLFARHARLLAVRVDLGYNKDASLYVDYETALLDRKRLCKAFHQHPLFTHLLGYAWKLEWGPSKGFHYHFLFFFDGARAIQDIVYGRRIGEYWNTTITAGRGLYFNCNYRAEKRYHFNAMGEITYHDTHKRQGLDHIVDYLTKVDEIAALAVRGRTFGHSHPPGEVIARPRPGRPRRYT